MTLQQLNCKFRLAEELNKDKELLTSLESRAYSPSTPSMSGMPHGTAVSHKTEIYATEIADLKHRIAELEEEMDLATDTLNEYFQKIKDTRLRTIFRLRFSHCLAWKEVADLSGPFYTTETIQKLVYGYVKAHK